MRNKNVRATHWYGVICKNSDCRHFIKLGSYRAGRAPDVQLQPNDQLMKYPCQRCNQAHVYNDAELVCSQSEDRYVPDSAAEKKLAIERKHRAAG